MPHDPPSPSPSPWWEPARHADRRPILLARNRIDAAMRGYLADNDFIIVDPPGLQRSPGNEAHLHAFATQMIGEDGVAVPRYLHTSPEFSMKKLLAAGERHIASFGHVWRNRERGPLHHPEFTMLEWYRVGEPYDAVMDDCVALIRRAAEIAGTSRLRYRDRAADPFAAPERLSVADAFARYAGSIFSQLSPRTAAPTPPPLQRPWSGPALPYPPTSPGRTFSPAFWWKKWSLSLGWAG